MFGIAQLFLILSFSIGRTVIHCHSLRLCIKFILVVFYLNYSTSDISNLYFHVFFMRRDHFYFSSCHYFSAFKSLTIVKVLAELLSSKELSCEPNLSPSRWFSRKPSRKYLLQHKSEMTKGSFFFLSFLCHLITEWRFVYETFCREHIRISFRMTHTLHS